MHIKQKLIRVKAKINQFSKKLSYRQKIYYLAGSAVLLGAILYGVLFWTKPVDFIFASQTCVPQQTWLPRLLKPSGSTDYSVGIVEGFKIGNYPITGKAVCFTPETATSVGNKKVALSPFGSVFFKKHFNIEINNLPEVKTEVFNAPIPAQIPLKIGLSTSDSLHEYSVNADEKTADCTPANEAIECDIPSLKLTQGKKYNLSISRSFKEKTARIVKTEVEILKATEITKSSIKNGSTVYSKPTTIQLSTDKKLSEASTKLELIKDGKRQEIEQKSEINDKGLLVTFAKPLTRNSNFELKIISLVATDGSGLAKPYVLKFKMSGGPKVTGVNVGSYAVSPSAVVTISFDQKLNSKQDITELVSLSGGSYGLSKGSNYISLALNNIGACKDFKISIKNEIKSAYDISGHSGYAFNSRTLCQRVSTIGHTEDGRPIRAYYFGSGSTTLFTGAIHGDEISSYYLMSQWIDILERRAREIPSGRQVVVVPGVNRDGMATGTRRNSNNVDLNRNFPTSNWQEDVENPDGTIEGGGGDEPLSESEAKALANLTLNLSPRAVLNYHSIGGLVMGNRAGNSESLAATYASLSGYWHAPPGDDPFGYSITGSYEDWLYETPGIPALTIELGSHTYSQIERNEAAMWAILKR